MSLKSYISAMPKLDLGLTFEGAVPLASWLNLADMNEIPLRSKQVAPIVRQLESPDPASLDTLYGSLGGWVQNVEDLVRLVYDAGVALAKQNVIYAEMSITPTRYTASDVTFETLMEALSDGRQRVERGWGTKIRWVFNIPRDEARRADEIVRSANSPAGRKHGVVAVGLSGDETNQQLVNYERALSGAERKGIARVIRAGEQTGAQGIREVLNELPVSRIVTSFPVASDPELLAQLAASDVTVDVALALADALGTSGPGVSYPLAELINAGVSTTVTAFAPARLGKSTSDVYESAADLGLDVDQLDALVLAAVAASGLEDAEKAEIARRIRSAQSALRAEQLTQEDA